MLVPSAKPTVQRYFQLVFSRHSLCRHLVYECLPGIRLEGTTLDIGGTKHSNYYSLFAEHGPITTLNASTEHGGGGDIIAACNNPLPLESGSYDNVISLNTFEHIKNDTLLISESLRILRSGGTFHFFAPFLFREHGCPFDYHRHTGQWWEEKLMEEGLGTEDFSVRSLAWDQYAAGLSFFEPQNRFLRTAERFLFLLPGLRLAKSKKSRSTPPALAYYITGKINRPGRS